MAEVVAQSTVLSDSTFRTRPNFTAYVRTDSNALGNAMQQIEEKRRQRQLKIPSTTGRKSVESFRNPQSPNNPSFVKYNDQGDYRAPAPYRSFDNIIDPISGFVSAGADYDRNTGRTRIRSMVQLNDTPQSRSPYEVHSIRVGVPGAPPETRRSSEKDPGAPYPWNGRKVLDVVLRTQLGGWTSDHDPRSPPQAVLQGTPAKSQADENRDLREKLALKYMYTSSTQRSYEDILWDKILKPKKWAPVTTLEERPDMISQRWTNKRYAPKSEDYQAMGPSWDRLQVRKNYWKDGPIPGTNFCTPCPRARQIPQYSGCIGAENITEIDNVKENFQPFTVKRVAIPRSTQTANRPNIPGYAGCTLYRPSTAPSHFIAPDPEQRTTADTHRPIPVERPKTIHRDSQMSRMVTTVTPSNPFNRFTPPIKVN